MFKEYDVVVANRQLDNVPCGTIGAVLMVYDNGNAYEVKFVDDAGDTISVLTVNSDDITYLKKD